MSMLCRWQRRSELVGMLPYGPSIRKCREEASLALRQVSIHHIAAARVIKSPEQIREKNNLGKEKYQ